MQLSNDDLAIKTVHENEKNINVNLKNRKYNLIKLKQIYQEQINNMKIKVEQLKKSKHDNKFDNINQTNLEQYKKKINEVECQNKEIIIKTKEIENENEKLELFFRNYLEKNKKSGKD